MSKQQIIERISGELTGESLKFNELQKDAFEKMAERLNRALKLLSVELYNKEIHFALELIQNADDNEYDDMLVQNANDIEYKRLDVPTLVFLINNQRVHVQNNETGFEEKHVKALCDIGNTTKQSLRHIGEKGIGFKSVFRVTDTPQIFSNRYRFEFRRNDRDILSYIVPYWITDKPDYIIRSKFNTNIILPFKIGLSREELCKKLYEINPNLLLFLRKLARIKISDEIENTIIQIRKRSDNGIVRLTKFIKDKDSEKQRIQFESLWKLFRNTLVIPDEIRFEEEKRKDAEKTELILAFPLQKDETANTSRKQDVFAYLPVRNHGFKFVIQADFLLTSNREDILKGNKWNDWLRDNIVPTFLLAVESFKQYEGLKRTFYNYLPLSHEIIQDEDKFFLPVVGILYEELRESACIFTESGQWKKPDDVFNIATNDKIRFLIPNTELSTLLHKQVEYISPDIQADLSILDTLGVKRFTFERLVECLNNTIWLQQQDDDWFIKLYIYLFDLTEGDSTSQYIRKLKTLKIARIENGNLVSIQESESQSKAVFFPLSKKTNYGFEQELRIVKRTFLRRDEQPHGNKVIQFLKKLGIRNADSYEIIENHILPIYENNDKASNWESKSDDLLMGYICYIKDHIEDYEKKAASFKRLNLLHFYAKKNDGSVFYEKVENLYIAKKDYNNEIDLENLFKGIDDIMFVHSAYLSKGGKAEEWREFFTKVGVNTKPKMDIEIREYDGRHKYSSKAICSIIKLNISDKNMQLLHVLDTHWNYYKGYKEWNEDKGGWSSKRHYYPIWGPRDSDWFEAIKTIAIRTTLGDFVVPSTSQKAIFFNKQEIISFLGDCVIYLDTEIKNEELAKEIGIKTQITVEVVLNCLKKLVSQKISDQTAFIKFYKFLNEHFEDDEKNIKSLFKQEQIIYIPNSLKKYFSSQEVFWNDLSKVFGQIRGYLQKSYPELKSFFVAKIGVHEKPSPEDYARLLVELSEQNSISKKEEKIILEIYKELNSHLLPGNDETILDERWWQELNKKSIFWTDKKEFWLNENNIFINDNSSLYRLFKNQPECAFLQLPENYYPSLSYFIKETKLPYLSESIKTKLENPGKAYYHEYLTNQIQRFIPYIERYIYFVHNNLYRILKDRILPRLKNIEVHTTDSLKATYLLRCGGIDISVFNEKNVLLHEDKLYIQQNNLQNTDDLAIELCELFRGELGKELKGLDDFLILLFDKQDEAKIENYLKVKGIGKLHEDVNDTENYDAPEKTELKEFHKERQVEINQEAETETKKLNESSFPEEANPENEGLSGEQQDRDCLENYDRDSVVTDYHLKSRLAIKRHVEKENELENLENFIDEDDAINQRLEWIPPCKPDEAEVSLTEEKDFGYIEEERIDSIDEIIINDKEEEMTNKEDESVKDIKIGTTRKQRKKPELSSESKRRMGCWGEEYIALYYLKEEMRKDYKNAIIIDIQQGGITKGFQVKQKGKNIEVSWVNAGGETGLPYDIAIKEDQKITLYIEVKSTTTREEFKLSDRQIRFMRNLKEKYWIYRVFIEGKKPRIAKCSDPLKQIYDGRMVATSITAKI